MDQADGKTLQAHTGEIHRELKGESTFKQVNDLPGAGTRYVLTLDGNDGCADLGYHSSLDFTGRKPYTLSAWVKPTTLGGTILSNSQAGQYSNYCLIITACGHLRDYREGHPWTVSSKKNSIPCGEWTHVASRYDGNTLKLYINGVPAGSQFFTNEFKRPHEYHICIGAKINDPIGKKDYFKGQIAEVSIWNRALTDHEIKALHNTTIAESYWRYLPFRNNSLEKLKEVLTNEAAIKAYNDNPFDPHAIARLRIGAYEKSIVMNYIDNILDWGDALFAQDSWESITQATILYFLAYNLLGDKPKALGPCQSPSKPLTFKGIKERYNNQEIPQFLIDLELFVDQIQSPALTTAPFNDINSYFCVPENEQFTAYWERVEDRLFKIRHCQNIDGIVRQLSLFEPPIDPNQLVRAVANGNVPASVVEGLHAGVPHYRFDYMVERAKNITSTLTQLGASLLSALEKQDAEGLALLHNSHEKSILNLITVTKEKQIEEARETKLSLEKNLAAVDGRVNFYSSLVDGGLSEKEKEAQDLMTSALNSQDAATALQLTSAIAYLFPNIFGFSNGGMAFGHAINAAASVAHSLAGAFNQGASLADNIGRYDRRQEEWEFQRDIAEIDKKQIEIQITAQGIRQAIAEHELKTHKKSMEHTDEIEAFYKGKFTNQELYQWMVSRLSALYFQTFKIAQDMALAAQKAYQYELNQDDAYIQFDYWDSLKKGLNAGEGLDVGFASARKCLCGREYPSLGNEKTISLLQLSPMALHQLKTDGRCEFEFNERHFAFDFPGHYCRQIKTIAVSIPAVVGPYQNINATLTQTSGKTLIQPDVNGVKHLLGAGDPPDSSILRADWRRNQKIALSRGINDSGLFELNFRDERYLPFEGSGAVSSWELSLPKATNRFDFETISDVIISLNYTALDGGEAFEKAVTDELSDYQGVHSLNLKQEFPGEWYAFKTNGSITLKFPFPDDIAPPNASSIELKKLILIVDMCEEPTDSDSSIGTLQMYAYDQCKISLKSDINNVEIGSEKKIAGCWEFEFCPEKGELVENIKLGLIYTARLAW